MTREEAIIKLKSKQDEVCNDCLHAVGWCESHCEFSEVIDMAIKALKQSTSSNMIYKQQAIDAVRNSYDNILDFTSTGRTIADSVEDILSELPPAQPELQWILVSERMPEEHEWLGTKKFGTTISDEVYVTFENEKGERFCKHMTFQNGELSRYDKAYIEAWYKGSKPIAWMSLPKPFEGGTK